MPEKKIKIWGMSNQDTGVQYYRINQPLRFIAKQKLANIHTLPFYGQHSQHFTTEEFREYQALEGKWCDIIYSTVASDRAYLALLLGIRDRYKVKLVIDLDDDILSTHLEPNNPAYKAYTNKDARFAEYAQACLREADLVTVSTEYLKRKYESINSNIVVINNCVDPVFIPKTVFPEDHTLTVGFAGSGSHQADWNYIEPAVKELKEKYRFQVKILGPIHTTIADEQIKWVDMLKYPETLESLHFDIGLAPLKDSMMARAKSNLRWLEYSALGIPTIASDVVPFRGIKNIVMASELEEWKEELEKLILDKTKRTKIGLAAHNEVNEYYDPSVWSQKLYSEFAKLKKP